MDSNTNKPDAFEQFIFENKNSFEESMPNKQNAWQAIEQKVAKNSDTKPVRKNRPVWIWKAASIILFVCCLALLLDKNQQPSAPTSAELKEIAPEFAQTEAYYLQLISNKEDLLEDLKIDFPKTEQEFSDELKKMDENYQQLKAELKITRDERILNAMIKNLKLRVSYLKHQIKIFEKIKPQDKNEKEATTI